MSLFLHRITRILRTCFTGVLNGFGLLGPMGEGEWTVDFWKGAFLLPFYSFQVGTLLSLSSYELSFSFLFSRYCIYIHCEKLVLEVAEVEEEHNNLTELETVLKAFSNSGSSSTPPAQSSTSSLLFDLVRRILPSIIFPRIEVKVETMELLFHSSSDEFVTLHSSPLFISVSFQGNLVLQTNLSLRCSTLAGLEVPILAVEGLDLKAEQVFGGEPFFRVSGKRVDVYIESLAQSSFGYIVQYHALHTLRRILQAIGGKGMGTNERNISFDFDALSEESDGYFDCFGSSERSEIRKLPLSTSNAAPKKKRSSISVKELRFLMFSTASVEAIEVLIVSSIDVKLLTERSQSSFGVTITVADVSTRSPYNLRSCRADLDTASSSSSSSTPWLELNVIDALSTMDINMNEVGGKDRRAYQLECMLQSSLFYLDTATLAALADFSFRLANLSRSTLRKDGRVFSSSDSMPGVQLLLRCDDFSIVLSDGQEFLARVDTRNMELTPTNISCESIQLLIASSPNCNSKLEMAPLMEVKGIFAEYIPIFPIAISPHQLPVESSYLRWVSFFGSSADLTASLNMKVDLISVTLRTSMTESLSRLLAMDLISHHLSSVQPSLALRKIQMPVSKLSFTAMTLHVKELKGHLEARDGNKGRSVCLTFATAITIQRRSLAALAQYVKVIVPADVCVHSSLDGEEGKTFELLRLKLPPVRSEGKLLFSWMEHPSSLFVQESHAPDRLQGVMQRSSVIVCSVLHAAVTVRSEDIALLLLLSHQLSALSTPACTKSRDCLLRLCPQAKPTVVVRLTCKSIEMELYRLTRMGSLELSSCVLNIVCFGSALFQTNGCVSNVQYIDRCYPRAVFTSIIESFDTKTLNKMDFHMTFSSSAPSSPLVEIRLQNTRIIYLHRACMTLVAFLQDMFALLPPTSKKEVGVKEAIQYSSRCCLSFESLEFILPINSFSNDGLVFLARSLTFHPSSLLRSSSVFMKGPWIAEGRWMSMEIKVDTMFRPGQREVDGEWDVETVHRALLPTADEVFSGEMVFEIRLQNTLLCSMCSPHAIDSDLNLTAVLRISAVDGIHEGIYNATSVALSDIAKLEAIPSLTHVNVDVSIDRVDWRLSQGQYMAVVLIIQQNFE